MIDISSAIPTILAKLKKMPNGHYIELLTYKKDRSIKIVRVASDNLSELHYLLIQKGYKQEHFQITPEKLKKTLKDLLKKEFPRSNKAHISSGIYEG